MTGFVRDSAFYKKSAAIAVPIAMQSMITMGVNMMDTIMVGRLGEGALSAVALANQFITLFQICCMGMGMGAAVLTARFWGRKDLVSLKQAVTIMLRFCLLIATAFALVTMTMPRAILSLYSSEAPLLELGSVYFLWSVPTYWLTGFSLTTTLVLRSVGETRLPLLTSIAAFFVNVGANYIFIFGKCGAPAMGVAGAALGTMISRILECGVIFGNFLFVEKRIGYRLRDLFCRCGGLLGEYLRISLPVLISDTLLGLGNNAVAVVMGHIGSAFVAANAITTVTQQLSTTFTQGISQASCIVIGHTLGEGDADRAQKEGVTFLALGFAIGILAGVIIYLISGPVIHMYKVSPETEEIARQLMLAVGFIVIFMSGNNIMTKGVLRGGGDTRFLMVADILFLWAVSIPLGALAGLVWHLPPFWIYVCLKLDQIIKAFWCITRLHSRKWIKIIHGAR
ncbi:MAG: MATE family efflux transporter [Faecousia sp.]